MYKNSFYRKMIQENEVRLNTGYNYSQNGLIRRFVSPMLFGNPTLGQFLDKIDALLIEIVEAVKKIQFYTNYTIDKNDTRFNL